MTKSESFECFAHYGIQTIFSGEQLNGVVLYSIQCTSAFDILCIRSLNDLIDCPYLMAGFLKCDLEPFKGPSSLAYSLGHWSGKSTSLNALSIFTANSTTLILCLLYFLSLSLETSASLTVTHEMAFMSICSTELRKLCWVGKDTAYPFFRVIW